MIDLFGLARDEQIGGAEFAGYHVVGEDFLQRIRVAHQLFNLFLRQLAERRIGRSQRGERPFAMEGFRQPGCLDRR